MNFENEPRSGERVFGIFSHLAVLMLAAHRPRATRGYDLPPLRGSDAGAREAIRRIVALEILIKTLVARRERVP